MEKTKEEVEFEKRWLTEEKLQFKLLTLVTVLHEHNYAYSGTLSEMCKFLGMADNENNREKLKTALSSLKQNGLIHIVLTSRDSVWTLILSTRGRHSQSVIRIRKDWVMAARACKGKGVDWGILLKVWLFLLGNNEELVTTTIIAESINESENTVKKARAILQKELSAIISELKKTCLADGQYINLGSKIQTSAWIEPNS